MNQNSGCLTVFHGFPVLEDGSYLAGYSALISVYDLKVPVPDYLCAIGPKHKKYDHGRWHIFTPRHKPEDTLFGHLTFALKYEGIDLAILNALFQKIEAKEIQEIICSEPTGSYSRRLWFLWEWLREEQLDIEDVRTGNFVFLVNSKLQYEGKSFPSKRHRVRNNLPGTHNFCPLIRKTEKLVQYIAKNLSEVSTKHIGRTHPDLLSRAAAFLLLKDSKASYTIEGERPPHNRIERWGRAIGEAGQRKPAGETTFLVSTSQLFQVLLAYIFLKEAVSVRFLVGLFLCFLGILVIALQNSKGLSFNWGVIFVLIAAITNAIFLILQKPLLKKHTPLEVVCYSTWVASIFLLPSGKNVLMSFQTSSLNAQ